MICSKLRRVYSTTFQCLLFAVVCESPRCCMLLLLCCYIVLRFLKKIATYDVAHCFNHINAIKCYVMCAACSTKGHWPRCGSLSKLSIASMIISLMTCIRNVVYCLWCRICTVASTKYTTCAHGVYWDVLLKIRQYAQLLKSKCWFSFRGNSHVVAVGC